jgi:hypothetical protein
MRWDLLLFCGSDLRVPSRGDEKNFTRRGPAKNAMDTEKKQQLIENLLKALKIEE